MYIIHLNTQSIDRLVVPDRTVCGWPVVGYSGEALSHLTNGTLTTPLLFPTKEAAVWFATRAQCPDYVIRKATKKQLRYGTQYHD